MNMSLEKYLNQLEQDHTDYMKKQEKFHRHIRDLIVRCHTEDNSRNNLDNIKNWP